MTTPDPARGRPRRFDEAAFLDDAINLFSAAGFSGVGISDITKATGLTVGSIYKAFGDKEGLFASALARYIDRREAQLATLLAAPGTAREKLAALLALYVRLSQGAEGRLGCMVVSGIADLDQVGGVQDMLRTQLASRLAMLTRLIAAGQRDGSVAASADPPVIAEILLALLQGMRVVGRAKTLTQDENAFIARALTLLD